MTRRSDGLSNTHTMYATPGDDHIPDAAHGAARLPRSATDMARTAMVST